MAKKKTSTSKAPPSKKGAEPKKKKAPPKPVKKVSNPIVKSKPAQKKKAASKPVKKVKATSAQKSNSKKKNTKAPVKTDKKKAKASNKSKKQKIGAKAKPVSKSSKKVTGKKGVGKKKGKKKNAGSTQFQKIKRILLERYSRRCNIDNDRDAAKTASNLLKWLKLKKKLKDKKSVTHKLIKEALNEFFPQERRMGRKIVPDIPDYAQMPTEFWSIEDVIKDIDNNVYRNVHIYSPLILGKKGNGYFFLDGNKSYTYDETFQGWVDFINEQITAGILAQGSPPDMWFRFTDVFWDTRRKRWEVAIIPCDADGNCYNIGYILDEDCDTDTTKERYGIDPNEVEAEKKAKQEADELAKQAKKEAKQTGPDRESLEATLSSLQDLLADSPGDKNILGAIKSVQEKLGGEKKTPESKEVNQATKKAEEAREKDFRVQTLIRVKQSIMDEIKFLKEVGEDYKPQIAKLAEVNKKIEDLWNY